jgi:hypothetical protein
MYSRTQTNNHYEKGPEAKQITLTKPQSPNYRILRFTPIPGRGVRVGDPIRRRAKVVNSETLGPA